MKTNYNDMNTVELYFEFKQKLIALNLCKQSKRYRTLLKEVTYLSSILTNELGLDEDQ